MAAKRKTSPRTRPAKRFFGHELPGVKPSELTGKLIVIEGADGSGRSTQIKRLVDWLEARGHATTQVGLKRSNLASEELERAKNGNILNRTTLSLFYATTSRINWRTRSSPRCEPGLSCWRIATFTR